jgi:LysM repeat protein
LGSLTAHLLETGDHGRLGFHPSCPVCRHERLSGSLSSEPVISRRVQAALASGVLAFSAAAPAAAIAKDPDRQQEGVAAPEQPGSGDVDAPDFDPGGETPLPFEVAPSPNAPVTGGGSDDTGEGAPVDSEPVDDPDARLLATEPETETPTGEGDAAVPPVGEAPVPPAPPGSEPVPLEAPPASPETPATLGPETPAAPSHPDATPLSESDESESGRTRELRGTPEPDRTSGTGSETASPDGPSQTAATEIPTQTPPPASPMPALAPPTTAPPGEPVLLAQAGAPAQDTPAPLPKHARSHVVQPGESLWSIAKKLLGSDASPAQIAREVNRLWELNKDRIGTGDPDLIKVGTELTLR